MYGRLLTPVTPASPPDMAAQITFTNVLGNGSCESASRTNPYTTPCPGWTEPSSHISATNSSAVISAGVGSELATNNMNPATSSGPRSKGGKVEERYPASCTIRR